MTGTAEKVGADSPGGGRGSRAHTALGRFGEDAAARWLADRGYVIADRNWRGEAGELDLVAHHAGWWVGVEVKTRSGLAFGDPLESIDRRKLLRLHRLTAAWVRAHGEGSRAERWRGGAGPALVPRPGGGRVDPPQDVRP